MPEVTDELLRQALELNAKATPGPHDWGSCRRGGSPTDEGSYEWVRYCKVCGMEDTCEDPLPPCPVELDASDLEFIRSALPAIAQELIRVRNSNKESMTFGDLMRKHSNIAQSFDEDYIWTNMTVSEQRDHALAAWAVREAELDRLRAENEEHKQELIQARAELAARPDATKLQVLGEYNKSQLAKLAQAENEVIDLRAEVEQLKDKVDVLEHSSLCLAETIQQQGKRADRQTARAEKAEAEVERLKRELMCDVCAGTGKVGYGVECICDGTGLVWQGFQNLRSLNQRTEERMERLRQELAEAHKADADNQELLNKLVEENEALRKEHENGTFTAMFSGQYEIWKDAHKAAQTVLEKNRTQGEIDNELPRSGGSDKQKAGP